MHNIITFYVTLFQASLVASLIEAYRLHTFVR